VALLVALPLVPVRAQQLTSITLSCSGTSKLMTAGDDTKPDPITNVGMIVNFSERTVTFASYHIPIERVDGTMVLFHGIQVRSYADTKLKPVSVDGSVDRVKARRAWSSCTSRLETQFELGAAVQTCEATVLGRPLDQLQDLGGIRQFTPVKQFGCQPLNATEICQNDPVRLGFGPAELDINSRWGMPIEPAQNTA